MKAYAYCCLVATVTLEGSSLFAADTSDTELTEVVVTAQRRSERIEDVPISITQLSSDQLAQANVQSLSQIQSLTPALRFDSAGFFVQPTIRGVGSAVSTSGSGTNAGIYVDGFYSPNPADANFQLLNIQDIQVLKGPQGTLFGRNTTAGAILVNTSKPSETTSGMLDVSYGSYNSQQYGGYVTTGLADHVAVDLAAIDTKGDGYTRNIYTSDRNFGAYNNWSVRTGIKIDFSDRFSVLARYSHSSVNDPSSVLYDALVLNGQPLTLGAVVPGAVYSTAPNQTATPYRNAFYSTSNVYQLTPTLDFDWGTLTSYTQFRMDNSEGFTEAGNSSVPILGLDIPVEDRTVTQEFILASKGNSRLQWTTGLFYFNYDDKVSLREAFGLAPFAPQGIADSTTETIAAYADATYRVLDNLYFTAGARYSHDEFKDGYFYAPGNLNVRINAPELTNNHVTPRVVLRYTPTSQSSIYASFTRGYKAAIENLGARSTTPIAPESIYAYEVGYKYAAGPLSFDTSAFYYNYKDLQVSSIFNFVTNITNAARSRIYGFEAQAHYELARALEITAGASYLNAKYTSFPNAPSYNPCFSAAACGAGYGFLLPTVIDSSGLTLERAPKVTGTLGARYTLPLFTGQFALTSNLYYTSRVYFDTADQFSQSGYALLGLRAEWTDGSGRYTVAVHGENVTDKHYINQVLPEIGANAGWAAPAIVTGELRVRF